jgi:uncharacterized DUF497 family protein
MEFEWFEEKRLWTLNVRDIDFRDARLLFDGRPLFMYASPRGDEERFVSVGLLEQEFIAVIWMDRNGVRRIISMRRARDGEKRSYCALYG